MFDSEHYASNSITQVVTSKGQKIDTPDSIFTNDEITPAQLFYKYRKCVTALVDGKYVGWGYSPAFVNFKFNKEKEVNISEITYWADFKRQEFCRYHCLLLVAFGGYTVESLASGRLSKEDNERYFTYVRGDKMNKSKEQEIKFRHLFDESGFYLPEYGIPKQ